MIDPLASMIRDLPKTSKLPDAETWEALTLLNERHLCIRCGKCCKHQVVGMLGPEAVTIARFLNIQASEFKSKFIEKQVGRWLLLRRHDDACPFLISEDGKAKCTIYSVRPETCRRFPWLAPAILLESSFPRVMVDNTICPQMMATYNRAKQSVSAMPSREPVPTEYESMGGGTD